MPAIASTRRRYRLLVPLTAGIFIVAIAGCGSSGHGPSASSSGGSFLAFSECMRSHGITGFPDPSGHGGINLAGTGLNPFSPAFKAAHAGCLKTLPGGGPPAHASEQQKQQLVATSQCMRRHGITDFPDPTTTPPSNAQSYSMAENIGGVYLLVPRTMNVNSPAYEQAAKVCDLD